MSVSVGDKVVAVPDGKGGYIVSEGYVPKVGDRIIAHPLPTGGYVALPPTTPKVGDTVSAMVAPYSYVPFGSGSIISYNGFTDHDLVGYFGRINTPAELTLYGDSDAPDAGGSGVEIIKDGPLYGDIEYKITAKYLPDFELIVSVCLKDLGDGIETWSYLYSHASGGYNHRFWIQLFGSTIVFKYDQDLSGAPKLLAHYIYR